MLGKPFQSVLALEGRQGVGKLFQHGRAVQEKPAVLGIADKIQRQASSLAVLTPTVQREDLRDAGAGGRG